MTYNVFGGTLNPTLLLTYDLSLVSIQTHASDATDASAYVACVAYVA